MVTIVSDTGEALATATLRKGGDDLTLAVERVVRGKGRLFGYYFSQGRRWVTVESGNFRLNGTITTEWAGAERLWQIRLVPQGEIVQTTAPSAPRLPFISKELAGQRRRTSTRSSMTTATSAMRAASTARVTW